MNKWLVTILLVLGLVGWMIYDKTVKIKEARKQVIISLEEMARLKIIADKVNSVLTDIEIQNPFLNTNNFTITISSNGVPLYTIQPGGTVKIN